MLCSSLLDEIISFVAFRSMIMIMDWVSRNFISILISSASDASDEKVMNVRNSTTGQILDCVLDNQQYPQPFTPLCGPDCSQFTPSEDNIVSATESIRSSCNGRPMT